ncbi:MAG: hypothetical protein JSS10_07795 [Verrucomicrobia bacterium]|nr:hypothetical protein [Verrucomicrobiota bacterium]
MRWIFKIVLAVLCFFAAEKFCRGKLSGFTVLSITSNLSHCPAWEVSAPSPEEIVSLKKILDQPYSYLGKGVQSFVFASQDGKYVIKLFRHDNLSAPFFYPQLPFEWAQRRVAKKAGRLNHDFTSYKLAYDHLKFETGLLFLHLNPTFYLQHHLDLVDKIGIHHRIPLDTTTFLIQKRAAGLYQTLDQMIQEKRLDDAKALLTKLVQFLAFRAHKGLHDKDPNLWTNFGVIGTDPVQIDVGRFRIKPDKLQKDDIPRITRLLNQNLKNKCPELSTHLQTEIEKMTKEEI